MRVLLVATTTGYQTRAFGEAAQKLGVQLVFATDRCDQLEDPWWDQAIPVRFHDEQRSIAVLQEALSGRTVAGVLAVGDRPTVLAARAADVLGLRGNSPDGVQTARNKLAARTALRAANLSVPWFRQVAVGDDPQPLSRELPYPCVVKPAAMSGSRGVIRANTPAEFIAAFARVTAMLRQPDVKVERDPFHDMVLIEAFIPGREYALEGVLDDGRLKTLAIFDKPDPLDGPFFEETIYVTPPALDPRAQARISDAVAEAAAAFGLEHGPVHGEVRVNEHGVFVLEVAARPIGGLCSRALRFTGGMSLEELLLRHAIGEDVWSVRREEEASGVMMIPIPARGFYREVEGVDAASAIPGIEEIRITAKPDQVLVPLPEGKSYLGFIFARARGAADVVASLRAAHARLAFRIERELPLAT